MKKSLIEQRNRYGGILGLRLSGNDALIPADLNGVTAVRARFGSRSIVRASGEEDRKVVAMFSNNSDGKWLFTVDCRRFRASPSEPAIDQCRWPKAHRGCPEEALGGCEEGAGQQRREDEWHITQA